MVAELARKEAMVAENSEKRTYTVEEIKDILGISKPAAYNLIKKNEFRYVRVAGGKYRVSKKSFDEWLGKGPSL